MIFMQKWTGFLIKNGEYGEKFPVEVPGNIQKDYARHMGWGDLNYMDNCKKFLEIEDDYWSYRTNIVCTPAENERVYFVSKGIEYEFAILLNGETLLHQEGMYTKVEIDITDKLSADGDLEVLIYPHPKREGAVPGREMADQSCKPADEYGWDWHPRVLVSGLWEDTYIETRTEEYIDQVEVFYELSDDLKSAEVRFEISCKKEALIEFYDMEGRMVYRGCERSFHLEDIQLWWCNEQGVPYLYSWTVSSGRERKTGRIGFRKVRLVMNEGAWENPSDFPKSRSAAPITIELNGRRIFAKGSNWVNPEVFTGTISRETYEKEVDYAKEAHMNILRCWGGAVIDKDAFFDRCDENGIMVWQEFPLACNNYKGTPRYLRVLEQEAASIIKRLRTRTCLVLWCGGNELLNAWSKMTDQSHALRLLDKLCYELDFDRPFLKTSPSEGMGHGHYEFCDLSVDSSRTVFELYRNSHCTAYSEFGVSGIADMEQLKLIFTEEVIRNIQIEEPWILHHGLMAWKPDSWLNLDVIHWIFGRQDSMEDYIEKSEILQCEGYKCIFEETRKQKGKCSMAINWVYNEPWITAAGNNLLAYPYKRRKAYYAVQESLRPILPSIRLEHFIYRPGEMLRGEIWLLNDSVDAVSDAVEVFLTIDGKERHIMTWETGAVKANTNACGNVINVKLPKTKTQLIKITLKASCGTSEYRVLYRNDPPAAAVPNALNF